MGGATLSAPSSVYMEVGLSDCCERRVIDMGMRELAMTVSENVKMREFAFKSSV